MNLALFLPEHSRTGGRHEAQGWSLCHTWELWVSSRGRTDQRNQFIGPGRNSAVVFSKDGPAMMSAGQVLTDNNGQAQVTLVSGDEPTRIRADVSFAGAEGWAELTLAVEDEIEEVWSVVSSGQSLVVELSSTPGLLSTHVSHRTWDNEASNLGNTRTNNIITNAAIGAMVNYVFLEDESGGASVGTTSTSGLAESTYLSSLGGKRGQCATY